MPDILVVDDSPTQATLMASVLRHRGANVETAVNGVEACDRLGKFVPDLVVTDMQMPEMNGVELIRKMRTAHPLVPAVLVTAYGNEHLASEALGEGAANYIAKEHVAVLLPDMAQRIAQFGKANAESLGLKGALTRKSLEFVLDCSIERITPLASLLVRLLATMNVLHTGDRIRIAEAVHYLIFHAVVHGNLGHPVQPLPIGIEAAEALVEEKRNDTECDLDRNVVIRLDVDHRRVKLSINHEGEGQTFRHAPLPGTPESFSDERSRGMLLMTSVMDEVFIDPSGRGVRLVKYLP